MPKPVQYRTEKGYEMDVQALTRLRMGITLDNRIPPDGPGSHKELTDHIDKIVEILRPYLRPGTVTPLTTATGIHDVVRKAGSVKR